MELTPLWREEDQQQKEDGTGDFGAHVAGGTGTYKILQRIVTPHPGASSLSTHDDDGSGGRRDGGGGGPLTYGEITTTIEEYYPSSTFSSHQHEGGPSPRSVAPTNTSTDFTSNSRPLYRRVAVRCGAQHGAQQGGGRLDASYELPLLPLTTIRTKKATDGEENTKNEEKENEDGGAGQGQGEGNNDDAGAGGEGSYLDPVFCWTSFGSQKGGSTNSYNTTTAGGGGAAGRKQLCVLAGPSLLRIFDVYPLGSSSSSSSSSNSSNNNNDDDDDDDDVAGAGGGEGHSVTLPFECGGIYAIPHGGGGGLLLQRAETAEESGEGIRSRLLYFQRQQEQQKGGRQGGDGGEFRIRRQPSQEESSQGGSSQEGSVELRRPPRAVRIEGSHEVIVGDVGKALEMSDAAAAAGDRAASMFANAAAAANADVAGFGVGMGGGLGGGGGVPSLFSLSHPLDDVRPVALVPPAAAMTAAATSTGEPRAAPDLDNLSESQDEKREQEEEYGCGGGTTLHVATDQLPSCGQDIGILGPFSDVNERLMYVGQPRNFAPTTSSSSSSAPSPLHAIVVTYHTQRRRHAVWVVGAAPPPPDALPLWKRTAASRRRAAGIGGPAVRRIDAAVLDGNGVEANDGDGGLVAPLTEDGWVVLDGGSSPTRGRQATSPRQPLPPAFGELHPTSTLSLLYEEEDGYSSIRDGSDSYCLAGSRFFLSTDPAGRADSIFCWVQQNRNGNYNGNGCVLRRLALSCVFREDDQSHARPLLLPDIPCIDAVPIMSSPVPEPAYSPNSSGRCGLVLSSAPRSVDALVYSVDAGSAAFPTSPSASLTLYRGEIEVSDHSLTNLTIDQDKPSLIGLSDPVFDRVTLHLAAPSTSGAASTGTTRVRASLGLVLTSSVAEATLGAIEASLVLPSLNMPATIEAKTMAGLALSIRADCVRFSRSGGVNKLAVDSNAADDMEWFALSVVLCTSFDELIRTSTSSSRQGSNWSESGGGDRVKNTATTKVMSDWDALLASDYHSEYIRDFGHILPLEQPFEGNQTEHGPSPKDVHSVIPSSLFWLDQIDASAQSSHDTSMADDLQSQEQHPLLAIARLLFDTLHLFYEDCKLCRNSRGRSWTILLGQFLHKICHKNYANECMEDFIDYYHRDGFIGHRVSESSTCLPTTATVPRIRVSSYDSPPSLFAWIDATVRGGAESSNYPSYSQINNNTTGREDVLGPLCPPASRTVCRLLATIYTCDTSGENGMEDVTDPSLVRQSIDRKLVLAMISEGVNDPLLLSNELPPGVALPFMEALRCCRSDPPTPCAHTNDEKYFSYEAYQLIGRSDLARMQTQRDVSFTSKKKKKATGLNRTERTPSSSVPDPDNDGLSTLATSTAMLYPHDTRIHEVGRLLRSSRPSYLRVSRAVEVTDHDYERLKQEKLLLLCRRKLALPLGRGMATLCTMDSAGPMHSMSGVPAEPVQIPKLSLAGRVPPTNATLALDTSACPSDMSVWPDFHNGVAAGLRLPKAGDIGRGQITRTWIVYNRPGQNASTGATPPSGTNANNPQPNHDHSHAGLLFALGLQGHLSSLSMTDVYDYLTQGTVTTTVGILLGMSACKKGSCDQSVSKMLCLHIPSLLPPSFATMEVAPPARTAAVAGIGLLYMGSGHRLMTEFLLGEIGRRPRSDGAAVGREAYALSCGLALGLVNLSKGGDTKGSGGSAGLSDLRIDERLHRYVVGGPEDPETKSKREAADRAAAGIGAGGGAGPSPDQEKCSCICEGENINTDVTAPGATLCLGLMYLQTGNKSVASRLSLPDTHFLLDYVRPDLLLLRVVSRALILWDDVKPTSAWIEDQIPTMVRRSFDRMVKKAESTAGFAGLASFAAMRMQSSPEKSPSNASRNHEGDKNHEDGEAMAGQSSTSKADNRRKDEEDMDGFDVDRQAIRQAHVHIVAGACLGMGLRYAGSGNEKAATAIMERLEHFIRLRDESDAISVALRPERPILEMCLSCAAVSLAMVMAGTGDVEILKLLRAIRWRCNKDVRYGTHMAIGSAIGLLFLGGGTCTLGTEPEDIAALLMAFFPRFPASTSDNQYHLQALRHCYALAVKHRLLEAIDIDTNEKVFVPIEIVLNGKFGDPLKLTAPCLLLNKGDYSHLRVISERYYPASLDLQVSKSSDTNLLLFVKKKSGHLSYLQDPHAHRSLLVQTGGSGGGSALQLIQAFTEDQKLLAYAKYLCDDGKGAQKRHKSASLHKRGNGSGLSSSLEEFCTEILHECLTKEKTEAIRIYLALRNAAISTENCAWNVESMWDIRLARSYYEGIQQIYPSPSDHSPLLSIDFVSSLCENLDGCFAERGYTGAALMSYFESGGRWEVLSSDNKNLMGCFLTHHDVPFPSKDTSENVDGSSLMNEILGM